MAQNWSTVKISVRLDHYKYLLQKGLENARLVLWGLPNARKMIKIEILAHKTLEGSFKNNPCEFQENLTILSSPTIPRAIWFLRALRARKIFDALRPIYLGSMAQNWPTVKISTRLDHYKYLLQKGFGARAPCSLRVALYAQDVQNWNISLQKVERVLEE